MQLLCHYLKSVIYIFSLLLSVLLVVFMILKFILLLNGALYK